MDKLELTREELTKILHAATGNVKDFVMNNDEFIDEQLKAINYIPCCEQLPSKDCVKKISNEKFNEWRKSAGIDYESHYLGFVSGVNWMFFDYLTK